MESEAMVGEGGVSHLSGAEDGAIMQPKIMEIDSVDGREDRDSMIVGKNKSVLMGTDGTNNEHSGDSSNGGNLTKAVLNEDDLLMIMENKRRRTEIEKAYAESELSGVKMGRMNEDLDGSKNVLKRFEEEVQVLEFGRDYIDAIITDGVYGHWRLTGLYGEPKRHLRRKTWELLTVLNNKQNLPWCIIGDLNDITSSEDKRGGNPYPNWLIEGFNDVLTECGRHKLELFGHPYTWECRRGTSDWVEVRIDRALASQSWRIKECKKEIFQWKKGSDMGLVEKYQQAVNNLNNILLQKELFWKQKSKQLWLREGDRNSKYFHATATARRRQNAIQRLRIATGEWVDWQGGLLQVVVDYFNDLFTPSAVNFAEVVDCAPSTVTIDQNKKLLEPVLDEEIKRALFQMHPDKSPGPDGMTPGFYQKYWSTAFIESLLLRMGFDRRVVELIMFCVSTVTYNVTHGGHSMGPICPGRGLRQGDPLSPYLFLICAEGFLAILRNLEGMMENFWWKAQSNSSSKGVSWFSWKRLCQHKHVGGLGFRDLRDYNLSFLGKQGWRLLTKKDTLVERIYKARYYPNGSFLQAELGQNPSFIWHSIWEAQALVRNGARRSIGSGSSVSILLDPWLPMDSNPFIISDHQVTRLRRICGIGIWNIRGYIRLRVPTSSCNLLLGIGCIWKKKIARKNCGNLKSLQKFNTSYGGLVQLLEPLCCAASNLSLFQDFSSLFFALLEEDRGDVILDAAMVSWSLWKTRNEVLWQKKFATTLRVVKSARQVLNQWTVARSQQSLFQTGVSFHCNHWRKLENFQVKVNVDGAIFEAYQRFGFGCVARKWKIT
uniref:Endonuclease/exonuclease/phosphatase domain-containing protein n=1 Tax=Cannabis sativa TaxID=3483 RepID=A0A803Q977_CANSA